MNRRILILTAGYGEGHNAAARALAAACDAAGGGGTAHVADIYALAAPRLNALVRRGYLGIINRAPHAWSAVYRWLDRSPQAPRLLRAMRRERRVLGELIARERPAVIACTYPAYAFMLEDLTRRGQCNVPFFNVVTDSISINSLWWRAGAAGWFVPNDDSAAVMWAAGLNPAKIHVLGFPVQSFFAEHARQLSPPDLARGGAPRVLYIVNSKTWTAAETARRLLRETRWEITCTVGRNDRLRAELQRIAATRSCRTEILGWTDQIPRLLMTHHVVVSKAGGATTQEALAARCPMLVNQIVPGQEEGNAELLRRHGVGALAETPEAVVTELQRAFHAQGSVWRDWRAALQPLSHPHAARDIAAALLAPSPAVGTVEPIPVPFRVAAASA